MVLDASRIFTQGRVTYWQDIAWVYASLGNWVQYTNAMGFSTAFQVITDATIAEKTYWAKYKTAIANGRDAATRFLGGIVADDFGPMGSPPGKLSDLIAYYETGELDAFLIPAWDTMPGDSAGHSFITALEFSGEQLLAFIFQTKAATITDTMNGAFISRDFTAIISYLDNPLLTLTLNGKPWLQYPGMSGEISVNELELGVPHRVEVILTSDVMDGAQHPNWNHTTQMELTLFSFDYTLNRAQPDYTVSTGLGACNNGSNAPLTSSLNFPTGNLYNDFDISPLSRLPIILSHNNRSARDSRFGYGWTANVDTRLLVNLSGSVVVVYPDGSEELFTPNNDDTFTSPPGVHDTLKKSGALNYQLTKKSGDSILFDASGKLLQLEDRNGNLTLYAYNKDVLLSITDPNGRTLAFTHDESNRVIAITDAAGRSTRLGYDAAGRLLSITDPAGQFWLFEYDENQNLTSKTDPLGQTTFYAYSDEGKLLASTDAKGNIHSVEYVDGAATTITDPAGNVTRYGFNEHLDMTTKVDAQGNLITYTYDENRNRTSVTDALGTVSFTTYDDKGNMLTRTDQAGNTTTYTYDENNNVLSITDPADNTSLYTYDASNNLTSFTGAADNTTTYQNDVKGRMTGIIDAEGRTTSFVYDMASNLVTMTDPIGSTVTMTYDTSGNMTSMTDNEGNTTTFEYDVLDRPVKVTDSEGNMTLMTYDALGNQTSVTDAHGNVTSYEYDHKDRQVKIIDALGQATSFTYSDASCTSCGGSGDDQPTSITDANGQTTYFEYDSLKRLVKEIDPLGHTISYTYDVRGNLVTTTDANGTTIDYSYDVLNRLISKNYPDQTSVTYNYDVLGNIVSAANQHISYTMAFDTLNRLTDITDSNNQTLSYQYDLVGNRTSMTGPDGESVEYEYHANNRVSRINSWAGDFTFGKDTLGRRANLTYPNGVVTNYSYDSLSRLVDLIAKNHKDKTINSFNYTHDQVGNRLSMTTPDAKINYAYDELYRLIESISSKQKKAKKKKKERKSQIESYIYDPVGNRLSGPKAKEQNSYNEGNQLVSNRYDYEYDNNGNPIRKVKDKGDGHNSKEWIYSYDYENRLIQVSKLKKNELRVRISFKYDPFGRRIEKREEKIKKGDAEEIKTKTKTFSYVYDSEDIILESKTKNNGKTKLTRYVHGLGIDEPLAIEQKGKLYYYHAGWSGKYCQPDGQEGQRGSVLRIHSIRRVEASRR